MLGTGGSYLGFVTGSLTSLKVPCALNAMEAAKVRPGSEEGEAISTIAIASSSIVTTLVIALGVFGLGFLRPVLESPTLKPAFDNILPALFGAMGVVFISKNPRLAIGAAGLYGRVVFGRARLSSSVGILVPVGALIAIGAARIMYKRGMLGGAPAADSGGSKMTVLWILLALILAFFAVIVVRAILFQPKVEQKWRACPFPWMRRRPPNTCGG